tara:strand:- start:42 stop:527 length:486 start_codon:yes stop_codon:yes gene_type:complete
MLKVICWVVLGLVVGGCSGGAKGDGKKPPVTPLTQEAILIDYNPVMGYNSHIPLVQFLKYDSTNKKILEVYIFDELITTFSWVTFKASKFGENLIGAMFINGHPSTDLYLWFQIQVGNTNEVAEYRLNLTLLPNDALVSGYETIIMGNEDPTRINVEYRVR